MPHCDAKKQGCGGCPLLEIPYPEQLAQKQQRINRLLAPFGRPRPILGMEDPWHYRNKAIATFTRRGGILEAGIYQEGTHRVVPAGECLLVSQRLNQALAAALEAARRCGYEPYQEDRGRGLVRHLQARHAFATGQVLVSLVTAGPLLPGGREFARLLRQKAPFVESVVQNINPGRTSAVLGRQEKVLYGSGRIRDELCGKSFLLSSRSFYQVNPLQTRRLYELAKQAADLRGGETVIDAYCGAGTIGLIAGEGAGRLLGVEVNRDAVADAIRNARYNKADNARFFCADASDWMAEMAARGEKADLVFLDPPRQGSSPKFLQSLLALAPRRVVYISCGPESLARDLGILARGGYRVGEIWPVDMFPHTGHIETVVRLDRAEKSAGPRSGRAGGAKRP